MYIEIQFGSWHASVVGIHTGFQYMYINPHYDSIRSI